MPTPLADAAADAGPLAKDVYKNVQVLGDLPNAEFDRVMVAITQWVAPKQGCGYCHDVKPGADGKVNYADDALYTDKVARRMIAMTMHINADWGKHVGPFGRRLLYLPPAARTSRRTSWYSQPAPHARRLPRQAPATGRPTRSGSRTSSRPTATRSGSSTTTTPRSSRRPRSPGEKGSGVSSEYTAEGTHTS